MPIVYPSKTITYSKNNYTFTYTVEESAVEYVEGKAYAEISYSITSTGTGRHPITISAMLGEEEVYSYSGNANSFPCIAGSTSGEAVVEYDAYFNGEVNFSLIISIDDGVKESVSDVLTLIQIDYNSELTYQSSMQIGVEQTVTTLPKLEGFADYVTVSFGSHSLEAVSEQQTHTHTFTVPYSWLDEIPDSYEGYGKITVEVWSFAGKVTSKSYDVRLFCVSDSNTQPDAVAVVSDETELPQGITAGFIENVSQLNVSFSGQSAKYGATMAKSEITFDGKTYVGGATAGVLDDVFLDVHESSSRQSKTYTLSYTVYDSRGMYVTKSETVQLFSYFPLALTDKEITRTKSYGTTYAHVDIDIDFALGNYGNSVSYKLYYRESGEDDWTLYNQGDVANNNLTANIPIDDNKSYVIMAVFDDKFSSDSLSTTLTVLESLGLETVRIEKNKATVLGDLWFTGMINGNNLEAVESDCGTFEYIIVVRNSNVTVKWEWHKLSNGLCYAYGYSTVFEFSPVAVSEVGYLCEVLSRGKIWYPFIFEKEPFFNCHIISDCPGIEQMEYLKGSFPGLSGDQFPRNEYGPGIKLFRSAMPEVSPASAYLTMFVIGEGDVNE